MQISRNRQSNRLFLLTLIFLSCNGLGHSIDDSIKTKLSDAKDALRKEDEQARSAYFKR